MQLVSCLRERVKKTSVVDQSPGERRAEMAEVLRRAPCGRRIAPSLPTTSVSAPTPSASRAHTCHVCDFNPRRPVRQHLRVADRCARPLLPAQPYAH